MNDTDFTNLFRELTGHEPLLWQTRLFREHFACKDSDSVPKTIDLPTGLGKTMVMAIWLIARLSHPDRTPTRLIYVVDRRTVVDQATDVATKLQDNFGRDERGKHKIAISTLRGQLADNCGWSRDPSRPAIIIGTVDLIGSALLFSSYRSGYKTRPLHAGLLGQDSLLVLDEAHLSKPFEKLLSSIEQFQRAQRGTDISPPKPLQVIRMSATSGNSSDESTFKLESTDDADPIIQERFTAKKRLTFTTLDVKGILNAKLKDAAIDLVDLAKPPTLRGKRIVVFVRKPDDARDIADAIRNHGGTKAKLGVFAHAVEVLTGTMRGLERDELVEKPVLKRFLDGNEKPGENENAAFLISTSAGEVGFDLNADHMVCDATTIDSMIQRLGRVNRRGQGDATVILIEAPPKEDKKTGKPVELKGINLAIAKAVELLRGIKDGDVSPQRIAAQKASDDWQSNDKDGKSKYELACAPPPTMVDLTDILLDNWSMTSITKEMPGRPSVGPWLRGIDDELPQTMIAWRAELELPGFTDLEPDDIEEWFDTHRILTHETLTVPTGVAAKWFLERWESLDHETKDRLADTLAIIDRAGFNTISVSELTKQLSRKAGDPTASIRNADVILPASFGGIERGIGMLDSSAPKKPEDEKDIDKRQQWRTAPDIADVALGRKRLRQLVTKSEASDPETQTIASGTKPTRSLTFCLDLQSDEDKRITLVSYIPPREKPEFGSGKPETLAIHVHKVRSEVDQIIDRFKKSNPDLLSDDVVQAAQLAADYHDHGKARTRWQNLLVFPTGFVKPHEPMGKSGGEMKRDGRGYRHEFGSLREFADAFKTDTLLDDQGKPISQNVFDLAMHLIATHHGRGRPHFPQGGFDPDAESRSTEINVDVIRRFARLQRIYGWWRLAWLENLLRCADAAASAGLETDDESDELEGSDS